MARSARNGITLVEVLVVISIVAILIGVFLPATRRVGDAAARATSQNHLKLMGIAMHNLSGANNKEILCGNMAVIGSATYPKTAINHFFYQLLPYMEGQDVFNSPTSNSVPLPFKPFLAPLDPNVGTNPNFLSYGLNNQIPAVAILPDTFDAAFSQTVAVGEVVQNAVWSSATITMIGTTTDHVAAPIQIGVPALGRPTCFAKSGCQVVLMDGSVRNVSPALLTSPDWAIACSMSGTESLSPNW